MYRRQLSKGGLGQPSLPAISTPVFMSHHGLGFAGFQTTSGLYLSPNQPPGEWAVLLQQPQECLGVTIMGIY